MAGDYEQAYQITDINIWVAKLPFRYKYNESGLYFLAKCFYSFAKIYDSGICFGAQSVKHANVLSEKINFSAPGG